MEERFFGVSKAVIDARSMGFTEGEGGYNRDHQDLDNEITMYLKGCRASGTVSSFRLAYKYEDGVVEDSNDLRTDMCRDGYRTSSDFSLGVAFTSDESYRLVSVGLERDLGFRELSRIDHSD